MKIDSSYEVYSPKEIQSYSVWGGGIQAEGLSFRI